MLTPQDIQNVKFTKSIKGYDKDQVDEFLDRVQEDYAALYKENGTLKSKMRVLVDKIEEYRTVDDQMRKALYSAQVSADETISKAKAQADTILREACGESEKKVDELNRRVSDERQRLEQARKETLSYISQVKELLERNVTFLDLLAEKSEISSDEEDSGRDAPLPQSRPINEGENLGSPISESAGTDSSSTNGEDENGAMEEPAVDYDKLIDEITASKARESLQDTVDLEGKKLSDVTQGHHPGTGRMTSTLSSTQRNLLEDASRYDLTDLRFGKQFKDEDSD